METQGNFVAIMSRQRPLLLLAATLILANFAALAQVPANIYDQAVMDFGRQKYAEAEQILRLALAEHPRDARALRLMALILDEQQRFAEAETFHRRALELAPDSASLYSNFGNHFLRQGQSEKARAAYLRAIELDPSDRNANSHLAQIAVDRKKGAEALHYLDRLPREDQADPVFQLLRAQALKLTRQSASAEALLADVLSRSGQDPRVAYNVGMLFATWKEYVRAEEAFSEALETAPGEFEVLYNLGLAALSAHDYDRSAEAFQAALDEHPADVDCMLGLARVKDELNRDDQAAGLLFQAQRAAPDRADLLGFLGSVLAKLGFYREAAAVYNHCLQVHPGDDEARRERGYALARAGQLTEAFRDLNWYVERHPRDPIGFFELAVVESIQQPDQSLKHFDRALELDPQMAPARLARGILLRQEGRLSPALSDFKFVLDRQPENFYAWEELGETFLADGRTSEALPAFEKAKALAPQNAEVLWRYGRALMRAGQKAAAQEVFSKVKSQGRTSAKFPVASSDILSLDPAGRTPASVPALRDLAAANPTHWQLRFRLGEELLAEGKVPEALEAFQQIEGSAPGGIASAECGRALLRAGQYHAARQFLESAVEAEPANALRRVDLTLAVFHDADAKTALTQLDKTPPAVRQGDYYLLRAQLLDTLGRPQEAAEALHRGIQSSPTRPDLYFQAALFMVDHNQVHEMLDFLAKADPLVANNPQLELTRAIGHALLHQDDQAAEVLTKMESRWPEWYLPYLVHGVLLAYRVRGAEAKPLLETAIALGAHKAMAYYHLAFAIITSEPENVVEAQAAIRQALALNPRDPYIQSLAGRIAYLAKDYPAAIEHLRAALEIWPDMVEAHSRLSATYRAMGEEDKSLAELKEVARIKQLQPGIQTPPFPTDELLFTVDEPGSPP
jgi:tetratricopeptide (TPR) repeat protein